MYRSFYLIRDRWPCLALMGVGVAFEYSIVKRSIDFEYYFMQAS